MFSPALPAPDSTLLQETAVRLAQTPASWPSQGRNVSLSPAGCGLAQLTLGFRLLAVNLVCNYLKVKSVGQQFRRFTTFEGFQSPFVLVYTPLSVFWGAVWMSQSSNLYYGIGRFKDLKDWNIFYSPCTYPKRRCLDYWRCPTSVETEDKEIFLLN